jgi:hypothetical protein
MLQVFLEHLEPRWAASEDWIYVVANAMWEGAEVDLVCILPSAILVADFKSYQGRITGTENGRWQADGVVVKGGSKANPFAQIRDNKFSVINWHKRKDLLLGRNLGHVSGCVIFSGPIVAEVDVSSNVKSWFHVTDFQHCIGLIESLASPSLILEESEAAEIIRLLGVGEHRWQRSRPDVETIGNRHDGDRADHPLTPHQQEAMITIASFLETRSHYSLAVRGMTSTGKSRVLAETLDVVASIGVGRQAIALSPNSRLAVARSTSIYTHLFEIQSQGVEPEETAKRETRIIPVRECRDPEDCVYLVDDAHLLSNALFETADGKRFGTGHLLSDFFEFAQIGKSDRQVIFFGDQYQISRGSSAESALDGGFQEARETSHQQIELEQLIDTTNGSAKLHNAKLMVEAIRGQRFAALIPKQDESFRLLSKQDAATELLEQFKTHPFDVWYLADTHNRVRALTQWLRPKLQGKASLDSVESGDLLEIFTAPPTPTNGPFDERSWLHSGQRVSVERADVPTKRAQQLKGRKDEIRFTTRNCLINEVQGKNVEILEEFLLSERPELSADIVIAMQVWCKEHRHDGFANARYGYASTVHHAQGMTQSLCYVNAEHAAGRHSEGYFRWLYTAATRAEKSVTLFNFEPIHPFDTAAWNPAAAQVSTNIPIGTGWQFDPDAAVSERDQQRDVPQGLLEHSKNPRISVAIWLRVVRGVEDAGWQVAKIASHAYQEQLELVGPNGDHLQLKIAYNGKNVVTAIHANDSADWQLLSAITAGCLASNAYSAIASMLLEALQVRLSRHDWQVVSATETNYRLLVTVAKGPADLVQLELNFDKQGLVSSIRPLLFSEEALVDQIRGAML